LGADVLLLDTTIPFTAARARNAGFRRLCHIVAGMEFVQFVDGDCQIAAGWLDAALAAADCDPKRAVVYGRCREHDPDRSIYNRLCDLEWNSPPGEAAACGGNALVRVEAMAQVGGYNEDMIAGEEPELCVRLRQHGWRIWCSDAEMVRHDAAMTHFWQWWRRAKRAGHAYAEGAALHASAAERPFCRETRSIWAWALAWPMAVLLGLPWTSGWSAFGLLAYPLLLAKTARNRRHRFGDCWADCWLYAAACVLGKWPQLIGQITYWTGRMGRRRSGLIEYKGPVAS
jgi:hypothetical protein